MIRVILVFMFGMKELEYNSSNAPVTLAQPSTPLPNALEDVSVEEVAQAPTQKALDAL